MFIRRTVLLLSALLFASGAHAQVTAGAAAMPTSFVEGERWEWQMSITPDVGASRKPTRTVVTTPDGLRFKNHRDNVYPLSVPFETGPFFNTKSRTAWMQWPLEVGKTWTFEGEFNPNNALALLRQQAKVVSLEEVTVPAGTFQAYKVQFVGTANAGSSSWDRNETFWYAPAVRALVKATVDTPTHKGSMELTSFVQASTPAAPK
jgi:hypothetical protein